jgi:hypothetical protein
MPEEECAGQRHARILTVAAYLQQTPRQSRGAGFCRLAHGQTSGETKSRRKLFASWSMSSSGWTSWCKSGRTRAPSKLCRKKKARRATVMPFAQTFEAPHGRFQERHNYATAIAREKPIGVSQTRDLRGRRRSNGWHAGWLVLGERIRTSKALYSTRHTSGGVASPARSFRAKSRSIWVCSGEPSLRTETVRSAASFLPTTKRTGTLASKCSRTL